MLSKGEEMEKEAKALGADVVVQITAHFLKALYGQEDIVHTIENAKKPADTKLFLAVIQESVGAIKGFKGKDPRFNNHVQTVADGANVLCWFLAPNFDDYLDENVPNIDFYGNKVLQLKQEPHTKWYKAYKATILALSDYVRTN